MLPSKDYNHRETKYQEEGKSLTAPLRGTKGRQDDVGYLDQEPGHHDKAAPALKTLRPLRFPKIEDMRPPDVLELDST